MDRRIMIREFKEKEQYRNTTDPCHKMRKHDCDQGRGIHNDSALQDRLFKDLREKPITFLEIGYQRSGGSLSVWRKYFSQARILGMDIHPIEVPSAMENVETYVMDQKSPLDIDRVMSKIGSVDVIVDDAIHNFEENWLLMESMMRYLRPGGMYIIEDVTANTCEKFQSRLAKLKTRFQLEILEIPYIRNENRILVMKRTEDMQLTIVSAASQRDFKGLIELICSLIVRRVRYKKMIIYDMGLDPMTLILVKDMFPMQNILIRSFDDSLYSANFDMINWKSMIMEEVVMSMKPNDRLLWIEPASKHLEIQDPDPEFICHAPALPGTTIRASMDHDLLTYFKIQATEEILDRPRIDTRKIHLRITPDIINLISEWSSMTQNNIGKGSDVIFDLLYYRLISRHTVTSDSQGGGDFSLEER